MKSLKLFSLCFALAIVCAASQNACAWGDTGHHLVVRLAMKRLAVIAPDVRAEIDSILGNEDLLEATMWPDGSRFEEAYLTTYNNHFVDISFTASHYKQSTDCKFVPQKGDCVIRALNRYSGVLLSNNATAKERRDALAFILHFVGDMHQPMHAVHKDFDQGGNGRKICVRLGNNESCYIGSGSGRKKRNLHSAWDSYIIEWTGLSEDAYFDKLAQRMDHMLPGQIMSIESGTTVAWAEQAHAIAVANAYNLGPKSQGFYHINADYYSANSPRIDEQILKGGIRLALVLKEIFADHHAHPSS